MMINTSHDMTRVARRGTARGSVVPLGRAARPGRRPPRRQHDDQHSHMKALVVGFATSLLVSGGLGLAGLGLAAGTAQAGAFHWCPGDPPITGYTPDPATGHMISGPIYPDWDTTVCHDYAIKGGQVLEGNPCNLPQFQWFQCPPGTTPVPQMPLIPNKT